MSQEFSVYAIRFDNAESVKLVEFLTKDGGAFMVVKELEDSNPHFHAVLHSKRNVAAVRTAFRKQVLDGRVGNGAYSITVVRDLDKYQRYMCKGESREVEPHVVSTNGMAYNAEAVKEWHAAYWEANAVMTRGRQVLTVQEAVLQACKDDNVAWSERTKIAEKYIRELVARDKVINTFTVRANVNLLQVKLCPDDTAILDLASSCVNY